MKLFSKNISQVSVAGVKLKAEPADKGGFILEVEDDFIHLENLFAVGFKRFEEDLGIRKRPVAAAQTEKVVKEEAAQPHSTKPTLEK